MLKIYDYFNKPITLEMTEVAKLKTAKELPGTWWTVIADEKHPYIKEYDLELPEIDFDRYSLIISAGREINKMTYTRSSKNKTSYKDSYIGIAIFREQLYPHTMFVYKIDKINLIDEEIAGLKPELRFVD